MSFSYQKGKFDRFFNRLDRPIEESRPDRQPDRPVDSTGFHLWCTVHQKMLGVHHYERVHKGALQAYRLYTQNL